MKKILVFILFIFLGTCLAQESDSYLQEGKKLAKEKKYREAIVAYKKALENNPRNWQTWFSLGEVYNQADLITEARECFQKVLGHDKKNWQVHFYLGELYQKEKLYNQAIKSYQQSLVINPNETESYFRLAECYDKFGENDQAIDYLEKAITLSPQEEYYRHLGWLYFRSKRYPESREAFIKVLESNPDNYEIHLELGMAYLKEDNFNAAWEESEKALKINPESSLVHLLQGFVYYQKGEKEKALFLIGKAKELAKSDFIRSSLDKAIRKMKNE